MNRLPAHYNGHSETTLFSGGGPFETNVRGNYAGL